LTEREENEKNVLDDIFLKKANPAQRKVYIYKRTINIRSKEYYTHRSIQKGETLTGRGIYCIYTMDTMQKERRGRGKGGRKIWEN